MPDTPTMETRQSELNEEIDCAASETNDLISVDDSLHASMVYIQQEYSDLSSKYQTVLQMLQEERIYRENLQKEALEKEEGFNRDVDLLREKFLESEKNNRENLEKLQASAIQAAASSNPNTADSDKLGKLKAAYQKLRADHILLIRQKAEMEKQLKDTIDMKTAKNKDLFSTLNQFLQKHDFLKLQSVSNINQMKETLTDLDENIDEMLKSGADKDNSIVQLQSEKRLLEFNCSEKSLASKEEMIKVQKLNADLQSNVEKSNAKLEKLRLSMNAEVENKTELIKQCANLEKSVNEVEIAWRRKLLSHLQQLSKRLAISSRSRSQDTNDVVPQMKTIFDTTIIKDPRSILSIKNGGEVQTFEETINNSQLPTNERVKNLRKLHDTLFYIMFVIMELQPYANITENMTITNLLDLGFRIAEMLEKEPDNIEKVIPLWHTFLQETEEKLNSIHGITEWDPSDEVDKEIYDMQESINAAAAAMEKLMMEAKANEASKPNIDVDIKIIDSCQQLLMSVQRMIKNARTLQKEITVESVPNDLSKEHYKKNEKWSEGLTSAAKDIGGGANMLVESANNVINGDGKFEELMAASQEIAGSTAQVNPKSYM